MNTIYIKKKIPGKKKINNISVENMLPYILKKQNKNLLMEIAKYKNIDISDIEDFINMFLKAGYYTPIITEDIQEEKSQYYYIKKKYKNIKDKYRKK